MKNVPDGEEKTHHHRIVPITLLTVGIPFALGVGFLLAANLLFHDEPKPNDTQLLLSDRVVPEAQNAYFDIERMDAHVQEANSQASEPLSDKQIDAMLNGGGIDAKYAAMSIEHYADAISDFRSAAAKQLYQDPLTAHPQQLDVTKFSTVAYQSRFIAKLVALDGLQKTINGDVSGGTEEILDVIRVGQLMESNQQTLIEWLVGGAVKHIGFSSLRQVALRTTLTHDQVQSINEKLGAYRGSADGLVTALRLEYMYSRSWMKKAHDLGEVYDSYFVTIDTNGSEIHRSLTGKAISALDTIGVFRFYYWPNQSWRFLVEQRLQDISAAQAGCTTGNPETSQTGLYSRRSGFARLIEANTIGKLLADIGHVTLGGAAVKACNETLAVSATQAMLAINAYRHDNNKLPATLEDLVPKYLSTVPVDPFSGMPLHYDAAKKTLYSVGQDRKDEQGKPDLQNSYTTPGMEWQNMFDPTFTVAQ